MQTKVLTQAFVAELFCRIREHVDEAGGQDNASTEGLQDQEDICFPAYPGEFSCKAEVYLIALLHASLEEHTSSPNHCSEDAAVTRKNSIYTDS